MHDILGRTFSGHEVHRIELNGHGFRAQILTLGAILQQMWADGVALTLGSELLEAYDSSRPEPGPLRYHGAIIGPVAGRLTNATGALDGQALQLEATAGVHSLHCGSAGLNTKVWTIESVAADRVDLRTTAEPGEGGLPGARVFHARYALEPEGLRLTLRAETDAATWVNLTQHSYWRLQEPPTIDGHSLQIAASRYLPINDDVLPTGAIEPVEGTRFDFRAPRVLEPSDRMDHCFCLDAPGIDTPAAVFTAPDGRHLEVRTDAPGLQVFTVDAATEPHRPGIAFEAQDWPDAPNNPAFPSIRLAAGDAWRREILFCIR